MTWIRAHLDSLLLPPIAAFLMFVYAWGQARLLRGRRPPTPFMRTMVVFSPLFILGLAYAMMISMEVLGSRTAWIPLTIAWAALLSAFAYRRYRKSKSCEEQPTDSE